MTQADAYQNRLFTRNTPLSHTSSRTPSPERCIEGASTLKADGIEETAYAPCPVACPLEHIFIPNLEWFSFPQQGWEWVPHCGGRSRHPLTWALESGKTRHLPSMSEKAASFTPFPHMKGHNSEGPSICLTIKGRLGRCHTTTLWAHYIRHGISQLPSLLCSRHMHLHVHMLTEQ